MLLLKICAMQKKLTFFLTDYKTLLPLSNLYSPIKKPFLKERAYSNKIQINYSTVNLSLYDSFLLYNTR